MSGFEEREAAWIALNQTRTWIFSRAERALVAAGFPRLHWYDVLWELERAPDGLRPKQLEQQLLFDQSSFSRQVARMAEDGLLTRHAAAGDGRGKILRITDEGRTLRRQMWDIYRMHIDEGIAEAQKSGAFASILNLSD
ncbi:MarR family winged helix-turn-helix transcriptional regulator [Ruegeria atlantica]|uniref:MarR family protein n=1 Tax=Ruegeria atlantica TaxID=81569 RepID=A0A0P1E173_9RHOB|nr:helix-turn-helix domain-containing protein [Ruegeria atlantica]CUH41638.1 MarR family protein [Ruegeria atlantica]